MRPPRAAIQEAEWQDHTWSERFTEKLSPTLPRGMGGEWTAAVQSMRPYAPQFHAIARQHVIDGDALFETLEVRLWRWHESYNGKRYWPLS